MFKFVVCSMFFYRFFAIFNDLGCILGSPRHSKNCKKSWKIAFGARSECVRTWSTILVAILEGFLQTFIGFGKDLGRILEGFGGNKQ